MESPNIKLLIVHLKLKYPAVNVITTYSPVALSIYGNL